MAHRAEGRESEVCGAKRYYQPSVNNHRSSIHRGAIDIDNFAVDIILGFISCHPL
jgi:hypothetical protein